jgi:hypothetical protein
VAHKKNSSFHPQKVLAFAFLALNVALNASYCRFFGAAAGAKEGLRAKPISVIRTLYTATRRSPRRNDNLGTTVALGATVLKTKAAHRAQPRQLKALLV